MPEWFEKWFGGTYLELYPHRDEKDAADAVALIAANVPLENIRVLDLACGPGRHSDLLRRRYGDAVGLDLSMALLRRARECYSPPIPLARGDMRCLPFVSSCFELVVNLFTSFGYFETDEENELVLREIARVLKRRGRFVIDYLNASLVRDTLVEHEEQTLGERRVVIDRRISDDGRFVFKEMDLIDEDRRFVERVRLFSSSELERLVVNAGFSVQERYGSYDGENLAADRPRVLLFSELL
ncbi:class I SAM-dependent methyltransferase [Gemmatimonadota bacterium]